MVMRCVVVANWLVDEMRSEKKAVVASELCVYLRDRRGYSHVYLFICRN